MKAKKRRGRHALPCLHTLPALPALPALHGSVWSPLVQLSRALASKFPFVLCQRSYCAHGSESTRDPYQMMEQRLSCVCESDGVQSRSSVHTLRANYGALASSWRLRT